MKKEMNCKLKKYKIVKLLGSVSDCLYILKAAVFNLFSSYTSFWIVITIFTPS